MPQNTNSKHLKMTQLPQLKLLPGHVLELEVNRTPHCHPCSYQDLIIWPVPKTSVMRSLSSCWFSNLILNNLWFESLHFQICVPVDNDSWDSISGFYFGMQDHKAGNFLMMFNLMSSPKQQIFSTLCMILLSLHWQ